jgi:methionine-S-sulfoxide reductase
VVRTRVGYTGGTTADPTYQTIGDHTEALQVDFDPQVITYEELLDHVWSAHDPTRARASTQYRAAVWCHDENQLAIARRAGARAAAGRSGELATPVLMAGPFYRAEDYHQKYRLRHDRLLLDELRQRYGSDRAMVDATAAARVNGLLSGWSNRRAMKALLPQLGLSAEGEQRLLARGP